MGRNRNAVNPFLIKLIVDNLMKYAISPEREKLGHEDVPNLRLVCRQWCESATLRYRNVRGPLSFGHPRRKMGPQRFAQFLSSMETSSLVPVQKYILGDAIFWRGNEQLLLDFFRICSPNITSMRFIISSEQGCRMSWDKVPSMNLALLQSLEITWSNYAEHTLPAPGHGITHLIVCILTASTNLKTFSLGREVCEWSSQDNNHFEAILKSVPGKVRKLQLTNLHIYSDILNILEERLLHLEEYALTGCEFAEIPNIAERCLKPHSASLKTLLLSGVFSCKLMFKNVPQFPKLEHLKVEVESVQITDHASFQDLFPKLAALEVCSKEFSAEGSCIELFSWCTQVPSLGKLYLPPQFIQSPLIRMAVEVFPNITQLHLSEPLDFSQTLLEVLKGFPNLAELSISSSSSCNVDHLITGVPKKELAPILTRDNFQGLHLKDLQRSPSFLKFTKLKKLVLGHPDASGVLTISDFSAHFVFLKMSSLEELHISYDDISPYYINMLESKPMLVREIVSRVSQERSVCQRGNVRLNYIRRQENVQSRSWSVALLKRCVVL